MAQIAITPFTAPQAPISGPPASGDESPFSPHLETAIAEQIPGNNSPSSSDPNQAQPEVNNESSLQIDPIPGKVEGENELVLKVAPVPSAISEPITHLNPQTAVLLQELLLPENGFAVTPQKTTNGNELKIAARTMLPLIQSDGQGDATPSKVEGENGAVSTEATVQSAKTETVTHHNPQTAALHQAPVLPDNEPAVTPQKNSNGSILKVATGTQVHLLQTDHPIGANETIESTIPSLEESVVITAAPNGIKGAGDKLIDVFAGNTGVAPDKFIQKSAHISAFRQIELTPPTESIKPESLPPGSTIAGVRSDSGPLLARLQEIINNSSETGRVSIKGSSSTGSVATAISEQPAVTGLSSAAEEIVQTAGKSSDQQLPSLRQNTQQQYYQAKVNSDSIGGDSGNSQGSTQNNSQSGDPGTQGSTLPQTNSSLSGIDQSATFQQTATLAQEAGTQISSESAKPILLPSGTIVPEENVVQQFMERFQIARRIAESKINIKLHPAELGELKIDLSVKEGSIKANVVAQSQQVQEVIERNIAKLRSVLEEQGYTLEAVTVTTESDSVGNFDLFERQLFSQQDQTPSNTHDQKDVTGFFDQEILSINETTDNNGVNVRV